MVYMKSQKRSLNSKLDLTGKAADLDSSHKWLRSEGVMYLSGDHKSLIHRESINGHRFTEGYFKIRRNKIITVLVCYETFFSEVR